MAPAKTIALFPEASYGAALNCVGIAQELRRLGHRPVFICHPGFSGVFAEYGFAEYQLTEADVGYLPVVSEKKFWTAVIDLRTGKVVGFMPVDLYG